MSPYRLWIGLSVVARRVTNTLQRAFFILVTASDDESLAGEARRGHRPDVTCGAKRMSKYAYPTVSCTDPNVPLREVGDE